MTNTEMLSPGSFEDARATWTRIASANLDVLEVVTVVAREWTFVWRGRVVLEPLTEGIEEVSLAGRARGVSLGSAIVAPAGGAPIRIRAAVGATFRVVFEEPPEARDVLRLRVVAPSVVALEARALRADVVFGLAVAAAEELPPSSTRIAPAIGRARRYIEEHLEETFDLDTLANAVGIERCHLCRVFRRVFGLPPYRYRAHLRLARARELLVAGQPCSEVAYAVGFCDQSHLTRFFKELTATTPGSYARAVGERRVAPAALRAPMVAAA